MKNAPMMLLSLLLVVLVQVDRSGSYLPAVLLALAIAHGTVLLVAAAELSNAKWIAPLKKHLLAFAPWQFVFPLLVSAAPYAWKDNPTAWLSPTFFIARNFALLLICAVFAVLFRRAALSGSSSKGKLAVAYIFAFVTADSVVAIDWVMSLDYPWISTMFPALYMIEALYAGLAVAGVLCWLIWRQHPSSEEVKTVYDTSTLIFAFALFWGGLFFAQYLTIWYGNIPEEVHYFTGRFALAAGTPLVVASVVLLFAVPFFTLLIHKVRKSPRLVVVLCGAIFTGLYLYRTFHVFSHLHLNGAFMVSQALVVVAFIWLIIRDSLSST